MSTYPGLPGPIVCDYLSRERSRTLYAPGTEFQIGVVTLCSNTGTYVDSPFHRYPDGIDLSELPLDRLADLDAIVIDAAPMRARHRCRRVRRPRRREPRGARADGLATALAHAGVRVGHPFLTEAAAHHLVAEGALLVGIDSLNIDDTAHRRAAGALGAARRRRAHLRAPRRSRAAARRGLPVQRGAGAREGDGHVSGAGLRDDRGRRRG